MMGLLILSNVVILFLFNGSIRDKMYKILLDCYGRLKGQNLGLNLWQLVGISLMSLICMMWIITSPLMWVLKLELSLILLFLPLIISKVYGSFSQKKERQYIGLLINGLARWLSINQDVIYCFEQLSKENYLGPYQTLLIQFNQHIKSGKSIEDAFERMVGNITDPFLRMVFTNLIFSLKHRGDLKLLMTTLEKEYIQLEEELSSRRIRLRKDKLYFYGSIMGVGVFMFYNLTMNMASKTFIFNQWQGQMFLLVLSSLFLFNTLIGLTLNDQKY